MSIQTFCRIGSALRETQSIEGGNPTVSPSFTLNLAVKVCRRFGRVDD